MEEELKELKMCMEIEINLNAEIAEKKAKFEEENKELFLRQEQIRENISAFKIELTEQGLIQFKEDGNKKLLGGLGIRVMQDIIYDSKLALIWAKHHELCLKLDEAAFKKIAKTQDIDFVTKEERTLVTFPKEIVIDDSKEEEIKEKAQEQQDARKDALK